MSVCPKYSTEGRHLLDTMTTALPRDYKWIIVGDFGMTERHNDKSNDCGKIINNLNIFC